jgi:hypothetical protein
MAIAVIGMHRSGTSMVTRMLATCGMQVGPAHELLGPSSENPTGYWERRPMVLLDDAVLDRLGLAWDHVPALPEPGWEQRPEFDEVLDEARRIVASFPSDSAWGWKDPRTSLVLPFWERALGEPADTVVCVRNPLDVAASLATRGGMSPRHAFSLWHAYSESALGLARARRHVITHYDAYFHDAAAELRRVCGAIGLDPTEEQLAAASGGADRTHRHSARGLADLVRSSAPDETVALYLELLAGCGPVMAQVAATDAMTLEQDDEPVDRAQTTASVAEFRREHGIGAVAALPR